MCVLFARMARHKYIQKLFAVIEFVIIFMRDLNAAAPEQPFFVYYVPGGSHSPHQPKPEWVAKFKGKFDMGPKSNSRSLAS